MTTPVLERVRAYRSRKKTGAGLLLFVPVSDEIGTIEMLIAARLLAEGNREDGTAIAAAAGKLIDAVVKEANRSLDHDDCSAHWTSFGKY
jgi:hypothetical protein